MRWREMSWAKRLSSAGILVGFIGTLMVIQPSFQEVGFYALLPLLVAFIFAIFMLITRFITQENNVIKVQTVNGVIAVVLIAPALLIFKDGSVPLFDFSTISSDKIFLLISFGSVGTFALLSITWSLSYLPSATTAPLQYFEIPIVTLFGWLLFSELPNPLASAGIVITMASGLYVMFQEQAKTAQRHRQFGELILAHLAGIPPRASEITVPDYYAEGQPPVTIKLDPDHPPQEVAQHYFDKYKRHQRQQQLLPRLIRRDRVEHQYLRGLVHQIDSALDPADLAELEQEMIKAGHLPAPRRPSPPARPRKLPRFVTEDGYTVLYGRTGRQNDEVLREADGEDIWLHVKAGPGGHVVIRSGGHPNSVPESTLLQAAGHAAALSKQASSLAVDVNYTLVKHIRKPKGSLPGFVRYTDFQTLRVRPVRGL